MSVRTDVINLNVNVNGNAAKEQLGKLRADAAKITAEMRNLKKGTEEWTAKNKELQLINDRIKSLRSEIGLTALSQRELNQELRRLHAIKMNLQPQTQEFKELQKQIEAVQSRLQEVRTGEFGFKKFWASMKDEVKQFGMLAAGYLGFEFLLGQTQNLIQMQYKMADQYADILKTSSLTKEEVKELDKELRAIDTRSNNSRLRTLAAEAGKLGKDGVADIKKFVEEADKIDVALGEDLGDEGLTKIAKLSGILNEGMINIASGINAVGAASAASESYQVDFAFRLAGTAQTAKIAAGDLLGYAAALEVNGQTAEVSGTAMSDFFMDFMKNTEDFGKAAGYAKGELVDLINNQGINNAFLTWLERLKGMSKGEDDFLRKMEQIGISSARGAGVFLVMANNIGLVKEQQSLANQAIKEGTSVLDEFNTKNNNFAATVERLKKQVAGFFTSDTVNELIVNSVEGFTFLIGKLKDVVEWIGKNKIALTSWTIAYLLHIGAVQKLVGWIAVHVTGLRTATIAQITQTIAEKSAIVVTTLLSAAKALLTGNMVKLRQELKLLTIALGTNPWTALLVIIGALLIGFNSLINKTKELTIAQKTNLEVEKLTKQNTSEKITQIQNLVKAINAENTSNTNKKKLIDQLIAQDPQVLKGLNAKNIATAEGKKILDEYIASLEKTARAEAILSIQKANIKRLEQIDLEKKEYDPMFKSYNNGLGGVIKAVGHSLASTFGAGPLDDWDKLLEEEKKLQAQNEALSKKITDAVITTNTTSKLDLQGGAPTDDKKKDKQRAKEVKALESLRDEISQLALDIEKKKAQFEQSLSAMHAFELQELTAKYGKIIEKAKGHAQELIQIESLKQTDLNLLLEKHFKENSEQEYKNSVQALDQYIATQEQHFHQAYRDGLMSHAGYQQSLKDLEFQGLNARLQIHKDYSSTVKQASESLQATETEILKKGVEQRTNIEAQGIQSRKAQLNLTVLSARPESTSSLEAKKALLAFERDLELENTELTEEEKAFITEQYRQSEQELISSHYQSIADKVFAIFQVLQQSLSSVFEIANNKDQASLNKEKANNESRLKSYKKQLDSKRITQAQYDKLVDQSNNQLEQKQIEFNRRKAKRDKASAIFSALINVAQGVTAALSQMPPMSYVLAALTATLGGIQIGAIASQPLPTGRKGLIIPGPSHESGGINMIDNQTGKPIAEIEGGEPVMVLSKNTYANNKGVIDELIYNSQNKNGAKIKTNWFMQPQPGINPNAIQAVSNNNSVAVEQNNAYLLQLIEEQKATRQALAAIKYLKAHVVLKEIEDAQELKEKAKRLSGIK